MVALSQPYGIESRSPNTSLLIDALPADTPGAMELIRVFPGLSFSNPLLMVESPEGSGRMFVLEKAGTIRTFNRHSPEVGSVVFLDIQSRVRNEGEQGCLGLAFDPDYPINGQFYVYYSWNGTSPATSRISRFTNDLPEDNSTDPATEEILLSVAQPYTNHNGGMIEFGPDGYLYIGLGDGGSGGDPQGNGQNTSTLLGSILRIDVRSTPPAGQKYAIPPSNPFASDSPPSTRKREIYAWGLRNPWRFSFDPVHDWLFCGDVGQNSYEEVSVIENGRNYGWNIMEASHCYSPSIGCTTAGLVFPIVEYGRGEGRSITGGYAYYGSEVFELYGVYIYADYVTHRIWGLRYTGSGPIDGPFVLVGDTGFQMAGFGYDASREVYALDFGAGGIYRFQPTSGGSGGSFPSRLSDLPALWNAGKGIIQTASGIIPYEPSAKLWSDGALKERFLALPQLDQMRYRENTGWDFAENAIIIKNFLLPMDQRDPEGSARRIETRLLYRKNNLWHGFTYEWNEEETDAQRLTSEKWRPFTIAGADGNPFSYQWQYPSRAQCIQCHTVAANGVLGLNTAQINHPFQYPNSGVTDNQLRTLDHIQMFEDPLPEAPGNLPAIPDPADSEAPLKDRARAYLAANCAMCHQPDGPTPVAIDLRWSVPDAAMNAIDIAPLSIPLGIENPRLIAPGAPERSILLLRMNRRGDIAQMPPMATSLVDDEALRIVEDWINSLLLSGEPHWETR